MRIKLNTINDVNNFSKACTEYYGGDIDVKQGRQIVDGRGILGIFSLNLMEPLNVNISIDNKNTERDFYNFIKKWCVKNVE